MALGNAAMMTEMGLETGGAEAKADTLRADGKTVMFIAVDSVLVGMVAVADPIKDSTAQAIKELHRSMLTGNMPMCGNANCWWTTQRLHRCDCSTSRMISSFFAAGYLIRRPPQPSSCFFADGYQG